MPLQTYPTTLPEPSGLQLQPPERRVLAGMQGNAPASARAVQRAPMANGSVRWTLTPPWYAAWEPWYLDTLDYGSARIVCPLWWFPWGRGGVVRLVGAPVVSHLGGGVRQVEVPAFMRPED